MRYGANLVKSIAFHSLFVHMFCFRWHYLIFAYSATWFIYVRLDLAHKFAMKMKFPFSVCFGQLSRLLWQISCVLCCNDIFPSLKIFFFRKLIIDRMTGNLTFGLYNVHHFHCNLLISAIPMNANAKIATMANKIESHQITFDFQMKRKKTLICKMMMMIMIIMEERRKTHEEKRITWTTEFTEIKWRKKNVKQQLYAILVYTWIRASR